MAVRDSWATQAAGPAGQIDVEEARVAIAALVMPDTASTIKAKSGFRPISPTLDPGSVAATGTPDGFVHVTRFQLVLQSGRGNASGTYLATVDATFDVNVLGDQAADPTNPRLDLIIAQQNDTFYGDGDSAFGVRHVIGTPAGSPAVPTVTGSADYVPLAQVRVEANATTILGSKITDLRTSGHAKSLVGGLYTTALGGILPVASAAQRNALTGIYLGQTVYRTDLGQFEVYSAGALWVPYKSLSLPSRVQGGLAATTGELTIVSVGYTVKNTGDQCFVMLSGDYLANGVDRVATIRLKEDGVTIKTAHVPAAAAADLSGGFSLHDIRSPSAGAHTYLASAQLTTFTGQISSDTVLTVHQCY
jgi:hypothetical protein